MAERTTERYWDPNSKSWQERTVFNQGQGKFKERLSTEEEAERGTKKLFSQEEKGEKPKSEMTLGELAAYNRKKREEKAKKEGQNRALSGS